MIAAAAAPMVLPNLARAGVSPNGRIGIGMIGVGRQAYHANLPPFLNSPDTQVVAVCEVDSWRLAEAKKKVEAYYGEHTASGKYSGCATHGDYRELLARPDIDAVMISSPDHWHVPMALDAVKAGKDVALEKPITRSIAEGRALADAVKRYGRVFRTDTEIRSSPVMVRAVELVLNGHIGKLKHIITGVPRGDIAGGAFGPNTVPEELNYPAWLGSAPEAPYSPDRVHPRKNLLGRPGWMRVLDYCDGMITNWGTHLNDIAMWGNGTERTGPVEIDGTGVFPTEGLWNVLTDFNINYTFANGVTMTYKIDYPCTQFIGTDGWVRGDWMKNALVSEPAHIARTPIGENAIRFPVMSEKQDFINCIKSRRTTMIDAEVGHRDTSLCHLGHIAIRLGRKLRWNPDIERFINDPMADSMIGRPARQG